MSFSRTIGRTPGVFYKDVSGTTLGLGLGRGRGQAGLGDGKGTPTASDVMNYPYGKYSAQTLQFQNILNSLLIPRGYCPIIADGKLGPATCGGATQIFIDDPAGDAQKLPTMSQTPAFYMPTTCDDTLMPKKVSDGCSTGPTPPPLTPAQQAAQKAALTPATGFSLTSGKTLAIGAGAALLIGLIYYVKR